MILLKALLHEYLAELAWDGPEPLRFQGASSSICIDQMGKSGGGLKNSIDMHGVHSS